MKRDIEYRWRARELMARHGMLNTRELRQKQAAASGENVVRFADAYKPVRARILDDD
jgi:hypothetical protein